MDIEKIERLAALRDKNIITEEDFQREKLAFMASDSGGGRAAPLAPSPAHVDASPNHFDDFGRNRGLVALLLILLTVVLDTAFSAILGRSDLDYEAAMMTQLVGAVITSGIITLVAWWAIGGRNRVGASILFVVAAALTVASIFIGFDENPALRVPIAVLSALAAIAAFQYLRYLGRLRIAQPA